MNCPDPICKLVQCQVTDDVPSYLGSYTLQDGVYYTNPELQVPAPAGGFYTVPPGTIGITAPVSSPTSSASTISYQGCISTITATIPAGASQAQIASIVNGVMIQIAQQLAICNTPPPPATLHYNDAQSLGCSNGGPDMRLVGSLPSSVSISGNSLTIAAGVVGSLVSTADANLLAIQVLNLILNSGVVQCGWFNQQETCPDGSIVPAGRFFSTISQADADAQALDIGCWINGFVWTVTDSFPAGTATTIANGSKGNMSVPFTVSFSKVEGAMSGGYDWNTTMVNTRSNPVNLVLNLELSKAKLFQEGCVISVGTTQYKAVFNSEANTFMAQAYYKNFFGSTVTCSLFEPGGSLAIPFTIPASGSYPFHISIYCVAAAEANDPNNPTTVDFDGTFLLFGA